MMSCAFKKSFGIFSKKVENQCKCVFSHKKINFLERILNNSIKKNGKICEYHSNLLEILTF